MSDRELLEWAAKAAGMHVLPEDKGVPWPDEDGWFYCLRHGEPAMHFRKYGKHPAQYSLEPWMPLTNDGDALRLAVKRKIFRCHMDLFHRFYEEEIANGLDENAATRRAIVRAVVFVGEHHAKT